MTSLLDRGPPTASRSLYVHVPFCTDRCTYCAFATVADRPSLHAQLVGALIRELARPNRRPSTLETLYLGGGTPGLLSIELLDQLLRAVQAKCPRTEDTEVTLEINPSNVSASAIAGWRELGITRLSMGIQTFHDRVLAGLGRHHDGDAGRRALERLATEWEGAWSADLLVGWAGQTEADLEHDLRQLLAFSPPHLSIYGLTIEPGTPLHALQRKGRSVCINSSQMDLFDILWCSYLLRDGYERYEVSNFAQPGARSRHNQVYWRNADYLGIGPGASSSAHPLRWSNVRDSSQYMARIEKGLSVRQHVERLSPVDRLLESLGVGLRTRDGLEVAELDRRFGGRWRTAVARGLEELARHELIEEAGGYLRIPEAGITRADSVASLLARRIDTSAFDPREPPRDTESGPPS